MNQLKAIIDEYRNGEAPYKLLEQGRVFDGVITSATLYGLLDDNGIPDKTQWRTVNDVANALGYRVVFEKVEQWPVSKALQDMSEADNG